MVYSCHSIFVSFRNVLQGNERHFFRNLSEAGHVSIMFRNVGKNDITPNNDPYPDKTFMFFNIWPSSSGAKASFPLSNRIDLVAREAYHAHKL